jgi:hypothetical protein
MKIKKYAVKLTLTEKMLGTVPKDPEVYSSYIETKKPDDKKDQEFLTVEKTEEKGWTGFHKNSDGLFIYDYMIRGFLKNAGNNLKEELDIKALKSKVDNFLFVFPREIPILEDNGTILQAPDGNTQRPLRAMTAQGPRVSVAKSDHILAERVIKCEFHVLKTSIFSMKVLKTILDYGQYCGLGQFRNGSYGRFEYEIKEV